MNTRQLLDWKNYIHRLRMKYGETPAGYQNEQELTRELQKLQAEEEQLQEKNKKEILNPPLSADPCFVGRENELKKMDECLKKNHFLFLCGIGGIGKTALAMNYGLRRQAQGSQVIFLTYSRNLCETIASDSILQISGMRYDTQIYQNRYRYFLAKLNALKTSACSRDLLVIIDDFNRETDRYFQKLYKELPCDLLFTSRRGSETYATGKSLQIGTLKEQDWPDFYKCYGGSALPGIHSEKSSMDPLPDQTQLDEIRKKIQGHTLSMKLYLQRKTDFSKNLTLSTNGKRLLDGYPFKQNEKRILLCASLLPVEGLPLELFCTIFQMDRPDMKRLISWQLLQIRDIAGKEYLSIHPLLAEDARSRITLNISNCKFFVEGLVSYLIGDTTGINTWNRTYEENSILEHTILETVHRFSYPPVWYLIKWDELVTFLWIQGYTEKAEQLALSAFERTRKKYGEANEQTALLAQRTAAVYYSLKQYNNANKWYEISLNCYEAIGEENLTSHGMVTYMTLLVKFQRKAYMEKNKEDTIFFHKKCLSLKAVFSEKTGVLEADQEEFFWDFDTSIVEYALAIVVFNDSDFDYFRNKILQIIEYRIYSTKAYAMAEIGDFYARFLYHHVMYGNCSDAQRCSLLKESQKFCQIALSVGRQYRGASYTNSLQYQELLADIYEARGEDEAAYTLRQEILNLLTEHYPHRKEWQQRIFEKMRMV